MASICTGGGLDWALGKIIHWKGGQALEQGAQGEMVESPSLKMFKKSADMAPGEAVQWVKIFDIFYNLIMILWSLSY